MVEDNRINQKVLSHQLINLGYAIEVAENGAEAVAKVKNRRYDLIFMDVQMPVMDGFQATQEIRGLGRRLIVNSHRRRYRECISKRTREVFLIRHGRLSNQTSGQRSPEGSTPALGQGRTKRRETPVVTRQRALPLLFHVLHRALTLAGKTCFLLAAFCNLYAGLCPRLVDFTQELSISIFPKH